MTVGDIRQRSKHARGFVDAAELVRDFATDAGITSAPNIVASLAVLAGIAASDAICGLALGKRAGGESHSAAVSLLATATVNGAAYARDLQRLVSVKTDVQYSAMAVTDLSADDLLRWARRLLAGMESELRGSGL